MLLKVYSWRSDSALVFLDQSDDYPTSLFLTGPLSILLSLDPLG